MNSIIESQLLSILKKADRIIELGVKVLETKVEDIERKKEYEEMSKVPKRDSQ